MLFFEDKCRQAQSILEVVQLAGEHLRDIAQRGFGAIFPAAVRDVAIQLESATARHLPSVREALGPWLHAGGKPFEFDPPLSIRTTHKLKVWPKYYNDLVEGRKPYEIRQNDRDFKVGDRLHLCEWCPEVKIFSGREHYRQIVYMTDGGSWGLPESMCVLGLDPFYARYVPQHGAIKVQSDGQRELKTLPGFDSLPDDFETGDY